MTYQALTVGPLSTITRGSKGLFLKMMLSTIVLSLASSGLAQTRQVNDTARLEKIARAVTIYRDNYGVPHIYGPTDASCAFGYMYAQAEDNFWQIEDNYIRALGRASEVYGERTFNDDLLNRALEITKLARNEYDRSSPRVRELANALADGLNYFLATNQQVKPRLITKFEPWHVFAFNRFAIYQLFVFGKSGLKVEEIRTAAQEVNADGAPASTATSSGLAMNYSARDDDPLEPAVGSNMWAITPQKSESGHAMLLINPHQPFFGPGQWWEGHVVSQEGWNMSGASFFGSSFPTIGHNEHLGWSHTVNDPDIVDLFIEKFDDQKNPLAYRHGGAYRNATEWTDVIKVKTDKGADARTYKFRKTHHGPIVSVREGKPLAIKLSKIEEGGMIEQWYQMSKSRTLAEFKKAVSRGSVPMFNAMYADREGNIFYIYNGAVPRRSTKFDWAKPVDGSDPETDWQGYHSMEELPQLTNPATGYTQNCNQTPFTTTTDGNPQKEKFPPYMVREQDNARARISRRLLEKEARFTFDEWTRASLDTTIIEAETQIPELAKEVERLRQTDAARADKLAPAIADLKAWDGVSTIDSKPMTLFALAYERATRLARQNPTGKWLRAQALEEIMKELERDFGTWRVAWGEVNRLQRIQSGGELETFSDEKMSLPIPGAPGWLGVVYNFYTRPEKGQKRRYGVAGNSFVSVIEFGPQVRARSHLVFGQNSDASSANHLDQSHLYSKKEYKPAWFSKAEVKANSKLVYSPGQKKQRKGA